MDSHQYSDDTFFIFIFSLNNSGTTIMSQYINNCISNSYLPEYGNNEGQAIPEAKTIMSIKKWDQNQKFDWSKIKTIWSSYAKKHHKKIFIECSPPNLLRIKPITDTFPHHRSILSISSPYSYISSNVENYMEGMDIKNAINRATMRWVKRALIQKQNIEKFPNIPFISYEHFCKNPENLISMLRLEKKHLKLNRNNKLRGKKNFPIQCIIDMTPRHLSFLGLDGLEEANYHLKHSKKLLKFYGYKILDYENTNSSLRDSPLLANIGLQKRINWNAKS